LNGRGACSWRAALLSAPDRVESGNIELIKPHLRGMGIVTISV
jgi:hypothetical protein